MRRALILLLGTAVGVAGFALAAQAAPEKAGAAKPAAAASKAAADPTVSPPGWTPPKNAMGQPDISGYWTNATMTPLTRNPKLTDKLVVPDKDAQGLERAFAEALA